MYALHWITAHLATGHAPMSYDDLDDIRAQGISAIVNLCGEFCDLHQIEESNGFEVHYLPVADECAPDLAAMEQALDWLDEAIYLRKKVLVHCRLGHGRTGTFIAAYLLRRGFHFTLAEQTMKGKKALPATYAQRSFLKKYEVRAGTLRTAAPRIENRPTQDDAPLFEAYTRLLSRLDELRSPETSCPCPSEDMPRRCHQPFDLLLIESMYLSQILNQTLHQEQRQRVIERANALARQLKALHHERPGLTTGEVALAFPEIDLTCPLLESGSCLISPAHRPIHCRFGDAQENSVPMEAFMGELVELSQQAYCRMTGQPTPGAILRFSSADTISGKFVQLFFLASTKKTEEQ